MLAKHRDLGITPEQRFRFASHHVAAPPTTPGCPTTPSSARRFMAYVEWGTRLAFGNSQPGAAVVEHAPVPRWGWGEAPPYNP